ncbi:MAG: triose-phosphate isomerase [Acidobacteria bacterium]|nr:MAG: triose-phosphate isomerase [Acidobacteriota bacterium]
MSRKKLLAANWKMYKTPQQAEAFVGGFLPLVHGHTRDEIVICPPYVSIPALTELLCDTNVGLGGQNMYWEKEGAYTGEVSAAMLLSVGCTHVILGHSERRQYFGETDETVNRRLQAALAAGLTSIVCIGEVLEEREAGITNDVLRRQCENALRGISGEHVAKFTIAYEPVWAIGTGKTATPEIAVDAHRVIRKQAAVALGDDAAQKLRILYGGSIKPENAKALMSQEEIDGGLVGGASLDPKSFAAIVKW